MYRHISHWQNPVIKLHLCAGIMSDGASTSGGPVAAMSAGLMGVFAPIVQQLDRGMHDLQASQTSLLARIGELSAGASTTALLAMTIMSLTVNMLTTAMTIMSLTITTGDGDDDHVLDDYDWRRR
jgi:hypothetical protein